MKTIYIILATLFVGLFAKSQQSNLINNTWILEKLIINNTEHLFPDLPVEGGLLPPIGKIMFFNDNFHTSICNDMEGSISYSDNTITITASGMTLGGCPSGYDTYEGLYFGGFFSMNTANGIPTLYNYQIENINDYLRLTLTNPNGDHAIYYSQNLMVNDLGKTNFKIYPNPVEDILKIEFKYSKLNIQIYDSQGKLILNKMIENNKNFDIDMKNISKGIYFMTIKDGKNEKFLLNYKIIKK